MVKYASSRVAWLLIGAAIVPSVPIFVTEAHAHVLPGDSCSVSIGGNEILCPGESLVLSATPGFANYQWYRKSSWSTDPPTPIPGATDSTLTVSWFEAGFEFIVVASLGACTDTSEPVLVDGYVFLPVTVASSGSFTVGPDGEKLICPGDTVFFELLLPYTVNIQWTKDGADIPGAEQSQYAATSPGVYGVRGSPEVCPNYVAELGVPLVVEWKPPQDCPTQRVQTPQTDGVLLYPNPSPGVIRIIPPREAPAYLQVFDFTGRLVAEGTFCSSQTINLSHLGTGFYSVFIKQGDRRWHFTWQCLR